MEPSEVPRTSLPKWEADHEVCQILCHLASTAPRLNPTCLIMINCCLNNQIQTQKVGDDSPRTRRERQGMCSLGKKRVPPLHSLTLLILSIPNRINSKIMWEDSPGRTETPVCVFPAQTHFLSLLSSFSGSHLLQRCQFDDWGRLRNDWRQ